MRPTLNTAGVHPGQVLALAPHLLLVVRDAGLVGVVAPEGRIRSDQIRSDQFRSVDRMLSLTGKDPAGSDR